MRSNRVASSFHGAAIILIIAYGANIEWRDEGGCTSLAIAAMNNHADIVNLLLDLGAQIDAPCFSGATAVMLAAKGGHVHIVKAGIVIVILDFKGILVPIAFSFVCILWVTFNLNQNLISILTDLTYSKKTDIAQSGRQPERDDRQRTHRVQSRRKSRPNESRCLPPFSRCQSRYSKLPFIMITFITDFCNARLRTAMVRQHACLGGGRR